MKDTVACANSGFRILEISFPQNRRSGPYRFQLSQSNISVDIVHGLMNIERAQRLISESKGVYDAIAFSGFALTFTIGDRYHRHRKLRKLLVESDDADTLVCDGIRAKDTIERLLIRRIVETLEGDIANRRILVLSGMDRWGVSEVLSGVKSQIVFGDLMYNFRFGIPLLSLDQVRFVSPLILNVVTRAPLDWYFPGARSRRRLMPRWRHAFYWAEVIVGGMNYLKRYSPQSLDGKIVISNVISQDEIDWLKSKGASIVASLTPVVSGERISASVMEAALTLVTRGKPGHRRDRYLDEIIKLDPVPEIIVYQPTSAQVPAIPVGPVAADGIGAFVRSIEPVDFAVQEDTAKFAFVIHPLVASQLYKHRSLRKFRYLVPLHVFESIAARTPAYVGSRVKNLVSATGRKAEGWLLVLPITSKIMLRLPPEYVYDKLVELAEIGQDLGATVMGLGAYTSVVGDAGASVAKRSPIAITTGNSYTVAATMETIELASKRIGVECRDAVGLVVGATGSIGSVLARMLSERVREIILVSPRPERVMALGKQIRQESPNTILTMTTNIGDHIARADIVVTTTSTVEPIISVERLKPGALVCDVARPPDIDEESAKLRPDVLVIESGEIATPSDLGIDIGLPTNTVFACLAETMILALEGINRHYTIGRNIKKDRVEEIHAIGRKHGFKLAGLRTFGKLVDEEKLNLVAEARERNSTIR
jgi:predicted amino acid dehydrogenase